MNRRLFLGISAAATAFTRRSLADAVPIKKRERMLRWLAAQTTPNYTPAAFFLYFGDGYTTGSAAAKRHLEFFHYTDMDFLKIQFEQTYTRQDFLRKPSDWHHCDRFPGGSRKRNSKVRKDCPETVYAWSRLYCGSEYGLAPPQTGNLGGSQYCLIVLHLKPVSGWPVMRSEPARHCGRTIPVNFFLRSDADGRRADRTCHRILAQGCLRSTAQRST